MRKLALLSLIFGVALSAHGAATRWDWSVQTINSPNPQPGGLYPVLTAPGASVAICTAPANGTPCTNYATTYVDATGTTTCPTASQFTRPNSAICVAGADQTGGFGAWLAAGNYQYTVTTRYGSSGPFDLSVGNTSAGGGGTVSGQTVTCLPKASGASALTAASAVCDNGTTVTSAEPLAGTSAAFSGTVASGSTAIPSGFISGIVASPAFYNPHAGVDVRAAGAVGDCSTDDHDALVRAYTVANLVPSNPLPLILTQPPGGCYLTSTITGYFPSIIGIDGGNNPNSTGGNTSVRIQGKPGQDIFNFPDPTDVNVTPANNSFVMRNVTFVVDTTVDASASHPWRKPGRAVDDAVTNSTTTVTSANMNCTQGDVGANVLLTYPDTTTQSGTITTCNNKFGVSPAGDNIITLASPATETQTGVNLYIAATGIGATETVGNCAFAIDNRDAKKSNWLRPTQYYAMQYSLLQNINIIPSTGGNHSCGVFFQGTTGTGYANTWDHINIGNFVYSFVMAPALLHPQQTSDSAQGCDFCRYVDWKLNGTWPFIVYNGLANHIQDWQIHSTNGIQILDVATYWESSAAVWQVSIPETEGISSGANGFRIEGAGHLFNEVNLEGASQWNANNSPCNKCTLSIGSLVVNGHGNYINFNQTLFATTFSSTDPSNIITQFPSAGSRLETVISQNGRSPLPAGIKTAGFLSTGGVFFHNMEDLWLWPGDTTFFGGSPPGQVQDATADVGWYDQLTSGGNDSQWKHLTGTSSGGTTVVPVIGGVNSVLPAIKMFYYLRVKCPVIASFTLNILIRKVSDNTTFATISLGSQACSTTHTTLKNSVDLTAYDGGIYYVSPQITSGEVDREWSGWAVDTTFIIPAPTLSTLGGVNSKVCSSGHVSTIGTDGSITCTADGGGVTGVPFWLQFLGDGSDGALNVTSGTTTTSGEHWYSSINVSVGATLANNKAYPFILRSTGTCTIAGTISNSAQNGGSGHWGGSGAGGGGGTLIGAAGSAAFVSSGADTGTAGTAGGGTGGNGPAVIAGDTFRQRILLSTAGIFPQGAFDSIGPGGAHGGAGGSSGGAGGNGGGLVVLVCPTINFTGTIDVSGGAGGASTGNNIGAGGGGGGGIVILRSPALTNSGTITVTGGAGGSCGAFTGCGAGGVGGAGWSKAFSQ